ncbi:hypothetical protein PoB_003567200 [Plakobranchus ocellatus]|uniref:Uncharacterized protein n=1 Tax=Plakobranchus ocellatus TaxID=259542 RepID=A0AAV4AQF4_9GAST|nr:hypothetical protein PoB_003567200 [Plakobranchus ocellatus]
MASPLLLSNRATDIRPGCKTQRIAPTLRQIADWVCAPTKEREYYKTCIVGHVNCCLQCGPTLTRRRLGRIQNLRTEGFHGDGGCPPSNGGTTGKVPLFEGGKSPTEADEFLQFRVRIWPQLALK